MSPRIGLSRETARRLLKQLGIKTPPVALAPIIRFLKTKYPNLCVDSLDLDEGLSGVQVTTSEEYSILYNKDHHIHRKRFTISHEVGHFLLNHTNYQTGDFDLISKDDREIEANQFAAELLMPLDLLKKTVDFNSKAKDLALKFWVSEDAMNWRLTETKLYSPLGSWD